MTSPTALPRGAVINQRYEVLDKLGQGANGVVYRVRDHTQNMVVALKLIPVADPLTAWDEAHVLTGLRGQYMLPILNADLASGMPFIVTEVARHGSAADGLRAGVGVAIDRAVRWVQQACRGTARVHDVGLLHTDIKPDNLFIDDDGDALVADLGLACLRDAAGRGHFAGTPPTMAPEVAGVVVTVPQSEWGLQRPTSVASDVYSLGATLYWLIAGRPPFEGADPIACMTAVAAGPPPSIRDLAPHVPRGWPSASTVPWLAIPRTATPTLRSSTPPSVLARRRSARGPASCLILATRTASTAPVRAPTSSSAASQPARAPSTRSSRRT